MRKAAGSKGFTLVEIIISVAALSLICALVLKLFLLSSEVNKRADMKQHAVFAAANIIETVKSLDAVLDIKDDPLFAGAEMQANENSTVYKLNINDSWEIGTQKPGQVTAEVSIRYDSGLSGKIGSYYSIEIKIRENGKIIYELTGGNYFAKEEG